MSESISHKGKIISITPQVTTVAFEQHGACSECHAAGLCSMGDVAEKVVELPTDPYNKHAVGDEVEILLKASMGFKAVWLAYLLPLAVLLAVLLGTYSAVGELYAGLLGIAAAGLYYLVLWLFRDKLRNESSFYIKER